MSNPASFVVTQDRVFWSTRTNSHSAIIEEYGLHVDGARGPNAVSIEVSPENGDYTTPHDTWKFRIEQDLLPEWYDAAEAKQRVRAELPEWHKWHCCTMESGNAANQCGGDMVIQTAGNRSTQTAGNRSTQTAGYDSTQTAGNLSTLCAGERSTQTAGGGGTQTAGGSSTQTAGYGSTQTAGNRSTQTAGDCSMQKAGYDSTQTAGYGSIQKVGNRSTQIAGNCSTLRAGEYTVQIVRWYNRQWFVASRVVLPEHADRWFFVSRGVWRECTPDECARADERISAAEAARGK